MSELRKISSSDVLASAENDPWPNTLAHQFSASLKTFSLKPNSLIHPNFASQVLNDAEETADKPLDRTFLSRCLEALSSQMALTLLKDIVVGCSNKCESPIEIAMAFALAIAARRHADCIQFEMGDSFYGDARGNVCLKIKPQAQLAGYRVDFLLTMTSIEDSAAGVKVNQKQIVVECDGFDFHDRTVEQANRDRRRDRALQMMGLFVFRYTGSEIWRDVFSCADECIQFLRSELNRLKNVPRKNVEGVTWESLTEADRRVR